MRPVSSVTVRKIVGALFSSVVAEACATERAAKASEQAANAAVVAARKSILFLLCVKLPSRRSKTLLGKKKAPRDTGRMAALFLAKSAQPLRHRRVTWLTALKPITVAGPRPNRTAFPAAHACKMKSECMSRHEECQRGRRATIRAQRFFHAGLRFSTMARKPSCESSRR